MRIISFIEGGQMIRIPHQKLAPSLTFGERTPCIEEPSLLYLAGSEAISYQFN